MSPKSLSNPASRGFTLIEATISMMLLLVVLILSMTFLFSMRSFSQRQEMFTAPRQTARRAVDYLSYYVAGASDMFQSQTAGQNNPNALVIWTNTKYKSTGGVAVQNSWDNVTNAAYADAGTDILCLALPTSTGISAEYTPTAPAGALYDTSTGGTIAFTAGCGSANDNTANLALFKRLTGADSAGKSGLLFLSGNSGSWAYLNITAYGASDCAGAKNIAVTVTPGDSMTINAPTTTDLVQPYRLRTGVQFTSFRVKNGQLQQKTGLFQPANPDAGFTPLLDNVEDFQVAYIYGDGSIWNTASQTLPAASSHVPPQGSSPLDARDIVNVVGLRLSVVAHSGAISRTILSQPKYSRPAAENRAAGAKDYSYHYRMTATVMLRNRMLGG